MCRSVEASVGVVAIGTVASAVTYRRGDPPEIWLTLGFFRVMEALQVAGYGVLDQCGTRANTSVTVLSYLHIVIQPFFINAFAMELVPGVIKRRVPGGILQSARCRHLRCWRKSCHSPNSVNANRAARCVRKDGVRFPAIGTLRGMSLTTACLLVWSACLAYIPDSQPI